VVCDGIAEVREHSVVDSTGVEREVDTIILGTGFHVTDLPIADRVRGRDGRTLSEHWDGSLEALRGTTVKGFPNLFFVLGPKHRLGHTSVVLMAEAQAGYIRQAVEHIERTGVAGIEPRPEMQARWNEEIQASLAGHRMAERRLRLLVHRPQRPQLDAVARPDVQVLRPRCAASSRPSTAWSRLPCPRHRSKIPA